MQGRGHRAAARRVGRTTAQPDAAVCPLPPAPASAPQELGDSYAQLFHDLRLADLQQAKQARGGPGRSARSPARRVPPRCAARAKSLALPCPRPAQLLADPFLLAKFKAGVAEKRARSNAFTRTLGDVSRTLRALGLHHTVQVRRHARPPGSSASPLPQPPLSPALRTLLLPPAQAPVEDALVHVDVALPDYKIAFFLETPAAAPLPPSSSGSRGAAPAAPLASLDEEGAKLSGFVQNETPGTKAAKLRLLQSRGWVVLPLNWPPEVRGEAEKRRLLLEQLDRAGQEQLMRGRVR